jgi:hypothetical protein
MTDLPTPDQVREALDKFEEGWCDGVNLVELTRIIDTTRAYASGSLVALPRCKTCGGSGTYTTPPSLMLHSCTDCIDGWPRELVERVGLTLFIVDMDAKRDAAVTYSHLTDHSRGKYESMAVAVLAALREETQ